MPLLVTAQLAVSLIWYGASCGTWHVARASFCTCTWHVMQALKGAKQKQKTTTTIARGWGGGGGVLAPKTLNPFKTTITICHFPYPIT